MKVPMMLVHMQVLPEPQEAVPKEQDVEADPQHEHSEASADHVSNIRHNCNLKS